MQILPGYFYFISDDFFNLVNDSYLMKNRSDKNGNLRPHYFALCDSNTGLYWMVPISSKVDKYKKIIWERKAANKPNDGIKVVKLFGDERVLLFQNMFPVTESYITGPYVKGGQNVGFVDPKEVFELQRAARKVIKLIHRGIRFNSTQPDVLRIEQMMLNELSSGKS